MIHCESDNELEGGASNPSLTLPLPLRTGDPLHSIIDETIFTRINNYAYVESKSKRMSACINAIPNNITSEQLKKL